MPSLSRFNLLQFDRKGSETHGSARLLSFIDCLQTEFADRSSLWETLASTNSTYYSDMDVLQHCQELIKQRLAKHENDCYY